MTSHPAIKAAIFDLDGLLLDTESVTMQVVRRILTRYGKSLTEDVAREALGMRPKESWTFLVEKLHIPASAEELLNESEDQLRKRWVEVQALPGAARLLRHLHECKLPIAVATSTPRTSYELKMRAHGVLSELLTASVCGDEVDRGKPAPDVFEEAARRLRVPCSHVLAFEDAPNGIKAALSAGMHVVAVPSVVDIEGYLENGSCLFLKSLLDFLPTNFGLPPFTDLIGRTIPLDRWWRVRGPVIPGFGRGSRELGIPTANISADVCGQCIAGAVTGIYCGWASIGECSDVYMTVLSVGYNPFYGNKRKTFEPWLLSVFDKDFYGEELRVLVCAYLRPEADFDSLDALRLQIHDDADVARVALKHPNLAVLAHDAFLKPMMPGNNDVQNISGS